MGLLDFIPGIIDSVANITAPQRQYKWNKKAMMDENALNRQNQEWMLDQNKQLLQEQRAYDSAKAQMERFKEAGLNPNLIYGQTAGSSGPISVGAPTAHLDAPQVPRMDLSGEYISAARAGLDRGLVEQKTYESSMKQQVMAVQNEIARANPMLNPQVAASVANGMQAVADSKSEEYSQLWMKHYDKAGSNEYWQLGARKIEADVKALEQRLGLNNADLSIRNRILESKEFENAIKEIQVKWLKDGELNPEHVRQGLMLILNNLMK